MTSPKSKEQVVPEDIMRAAQKAFDDAMVLTSQADGDMVIARAILAERERCAVVAESRYTEENTIKSKAGKTFRSGQVAIYAAQKIAAAIRRPTPPKGGEE